MQVRKETHVFQHGHIGRQGELLGNIPAPFTDFVHIPHRVIAKHAAVAGVPPEQSQDDPGGRALPGSIRTDQAKGLATLHFQRDGIDCSDQFFAAL